ncbi:MAG TPA: GNAT family N-acetyltransferase, partial [Rhodospirillales bacterium]|nr:GNAT family N-acetyltransferase [Rhodospirillales bacterium]
FLANGGHIGNIKIGPIESEHRRATVGILIGQRDKWGEGFATEAISGATDYALRHFDVDIVLAGTYDTNLGSIAAFLKAGYVELARIPCYWLCEGRRVAGVMLGKEGSYVADG